MLVCHTINISYVIGGKVMKIQLIRHATLLLNIQNKRILVDPMLSPLGAMDAVPNVCNKNKNPLVNLPIETHKIADVDGVLITHLHRDHFDEAAAKLIPMHLPVLCQPKDKEEIESKGFFNVVPIDKSYLWEGIRIIRTGGQHGKGLIKKRMGEVSGYIIKAENEPSLYITGDTIWCSEVEKALKTYEPEITIAFAGGARFSVGGAITMTEKDIYKVCKKAPYTKVIAVHMEAWNHCVLTRMELIKYLEKHSCDGQVIIPKDGECLEY